jgi:hypothetical protein
MGCSHIKSGGYFLVRSQATRLVCTIFSQVLDTVAVPELVVSVWDRVLVQAEAADRDWDLVAAAQSVAALVDRCRRSCLVRLASAEPAWAPDSLDQDLVLVVVPGRADCPDPVSVLALVLVPGVDLVAHPVPAVAVRPA